MSDVPATFPESQTGAKLDPEDGMPIFGEFDGTWMSRQRYLDASRAQRQAELVADLRQSVVDDQEAATAAEAVEPEPDDADA